VLPRRTWGHRVARGADRARDAARRLGPGGLAALGVLTVIIVAAALLEGRGSRQEAAALAAHIAEHGGDPVEVIARAAMGRRLVLLSDIHASAAPKRLAADLIEALAEGPGLDIVVLEVESTEQPVIDRYLSGLQEDASILLASPGTLREQWGHPRAFLEIYRRVWQINQELGPARRIRIVAMDMPEWPPPRALQPREAATLYTRRSQHMAQLLEREVFGPNPRARVLVLVDGYQVLSLGGPEFVFGGGAPVSGRWLGTQLRAARPADVYSVLVDGVTRRPGYTAVASYVGTEAADILRRRAGGARRFAVPIDEHFDFIPSPVIPTSGAGMDLEFTPRGYRLGSVADAYVFLGDS
jgi:hypothetical protein